MNARSFLVLISLFFTSQLELSAQFKIFGRLFGGGSDAPQEENVAGTPAAPNPAETAGSNPVPVTPAPEKDEGILEMERAYLKANYHIVPGDVINVDVFQEQSLTKPGLRVSESGDITLPLIDRVKVAGLTIADAEKKIRDLFEKDYLVDPHVIVTVFEYARRSVAVDGEVKQAGLIDLPPGQPLTVLQVIAASGGMTPNANPNDIELYREGSEEPYQFRLRDLKRVTDPKKKFYVQPNDTIFVGQRII